MGVVSLTGQMAVCQCRVLRLASRTNLILILTMVVTMDPAGRTARALVTPIFMAMATLESVRSRCSLPRQVVPRLAVYGPPTSPLPYLACLQLTSLCPAQRTLVNTVRTFTWGRYGPVLVSFF